MKKFALYTAIFGKPGRFIFPKISTLNVDKFCYTDLNIREGCNQEIPVRKGNFILNDFYQIRKMNLDHLIPIRANRFVKICIPNEIFDNYEYSLYLDCKRPHLMFDFEQILSYLEPGSDFMVRKHGTKRNCVYEEGLYCIEIKKDTEATILKQLDFYKSENFPTHTGLYVASWIFRRHTKALKQYMNLWWEQIERFSHRDQISLPYVTWKYGMKISSWKRPE